jgi:hypothetical protein
MGIENIDHLQKIWTKEMYGSIFSGQIYVFLCMVTQVLGLQIDT